MWKYQLVKAEDAGRDKPRLLSFVEPPGADPHAAVEWGERPETGILTDFCGTIPSLVRKLFRLLLTPAHWA